MAAHVRLKNEYMQDEKYHNLSTWLGAFLVHFQFDGTRLNVTYDQVKMYFLHLYHEHVTGQNKNSHCISMHLWKSVACRFGSFDVVMHSWVLRMFARCITTSGKRDIYMYRNVPKLSDRQVWANNVDPDQKSSLIRIYCHSICIVLTQYSTVKPTCSNFRIITASSGVSVEGVMLRNRVVRNSCSFV